jgi:glycosyltransferase involved in cell wall biosynthesis
LDKYVSLDKRVRVFRQDNQGSSGARNSGLKLANGEYVHFHDSDDFIISADWYETLVNKAVDTNADITVSTSFYDDEEKRYSFACLHSAILIGLEDKIKVLLSNWSAVWHSLYKKSFIENVRLAFDGNAEPAEDFLYNIQAWYYAGKVVLVPNIVYYYRYVSTSAIHTRKFGGGLKYAYEKVRSFLSDCNNKYVLETLDLMEENFIIETSNRKERYEVKSYKMLGITLFKKRMYVDRTRYYLFGIFPVLTSGWKEKLWSG